jgi:hypothetical protein
MQPTPPLPPHNTPSETSSSKEKKHLIWWGVLFAIGWVVGNFLLEPYFEPVAVGTLYRVADTTAPPPRIRFIDLSALYKTQSPARNTLSSLPVATVEKLLVGIEKLPEDRQPVAIGVDFPVASEKEEQPGVPVPTVEQEKIQEAFVKLQERTGIPVRCGIPFFRKDANIPYWNADKTGMLVSSLLHKKGEKAPLWYGTIKKKEAFPTLGTAVALAAMSEENIEPERSALESLHNTAPPEGFPKDLTVRWVYVDYSLLQHRDALTVSVGSQIQEGDEIQIEKLFSEEDKNKLLPTQGRKNLWFLGVTEVVDKEDLLIYDEHLHGLGKDAEPVRRVYQHGALAHTYMSTPLLRLPAWQTFGIDLLCSLCGLFFILHQDRNRRLLTRNNTVWWKHPQDYLIYIVGGFFTILPLGIASVIKTVRRESTPNARLIEALGTPVLILLPICLSLLLALAHIFWFGFLATALYGLIEPILGATAESFGTENEEETHTEEKKV